MTQEIDRHSGRDRDDQAGAIPRRGRNSRPEPKGPLRGLPATPYYYFVGLSGFSFRGGSTVTAAPGFVGFRGGPPGVEDVTPSLHIGSEIGGGGIRVTLPMSMKPSLGEARARPRSLYMALVADAAMLPGAPRLRWRRRRNGIHPRSRRRIHRRLVAYDQRHEGPSNSHGSPTFFITAKAEALRVATEHARGEIAKRQHLAAAV
jgi:hypothetical protein